MFLKCKVIHVLKWIWFMFLNVKWKYDVTLFFCVWICSYLSIICRCLGTLVEPQFTHDTNLDLSKWKTQVTQQNVHFLVNSLGVTDGNSRPYSIKQRFVNLYQPEIECCWIAQEIRLYLALVGLNRDECLLHFQKMQSLWEIFNTLWNKINIWIFIDQENQIEINKMKPNGDK